MYQVADEFAELLGRQRLEELNTPADAVYGFWSDYRLAYLNPAWYRFAEEEFRDRISAHVVREWPVRRCRLRQKTIRLIFRRTL